MSKITKWLRLRDGGEYLLRQLTPDDSDRLFMFFYTHSDETIYQRYGYIFHNMSTARAKELVSVDQEHDLALAVFETVGGTDVIHAIGRYYLDEGGESAEMAFVVRESKRRIGMCRALIGEMIRVARSRGVKRLWAVVLEGNAPMLEGFRKMGAKLSTTLDGEQVEVEFEL